MNRREGVALACRIFSLYLMYQLVTGLPSLAVFASQTSHEQTWQLLAGMVITLAAVLILAFVLWRKAGWIATRVSSRLDFFPTDQQPSLTDFHGFALSILGMFVVTGAIPGLTGLSWALAYSRRDQYFDIARRAFGHPPTPALLASWIGSVILGVGLILGSRWLAGILNRPRRERSPEDAGTTA